MKQSEPSTSTSQAGKEFSASKGWLTGFLKRNTLHNIKITGESATAEEGAAKIFPEELAKIIEDGDYSAEIKYLKLMKQDFIRKKLPNRTYIAKDEKTASGHKASKDRVTLLFCSNASEDRMLKPLLINKSLRPCALKGKDLKQLPVHWMANPKAWMTTAIFTEWFNNCFVPEVKGRATQNENEVCENPWPLPQISIAETVSSDDEGDLEPLHKRCKPLSNSDND
ncbi:tigger transposable element-derived protein 1 [Trichonephila clavipes]|uniref:Tigger transposable element-derived protein 1 n=1 Tax=Trichonephila clavipes TaxID=2585209 RepID=A0A8X7BIM6_TRICX|nr:tigger transposable element-derived protein 1 [Trichonephila clavipes]